MAGEVHAVMLCVAFLRCFWFILSQRSPCAIYVESCVSHLLQPSFKPFDFS